MFKIGSVFILSLFLFACAIPESKVLVDKNVNVVSRVYDNPVVLNIDTSTTNFILDTKPENKFMGAVKANVPVGKILTEYSQVYMSKAFPNFKEGGRSGSVEELVISLEVKNTKWWFNSVGKYGRVKAQLVVSVDLISFGNRISNKEYTVVKFDELRSMVGPKGLSASLSKSFSQCVETVYEEMLNDISKNGILASVLRERQNYVGQKQPVAVTRQIAPRKRPALPKMDSEPDIDQNIPRGQRAGRYDVAVVIGNRDYQVEGVPTVDYALNDARTMRNYLEMMFGYRPDNIIYLENATYAALSQVFGSDRDHRGKLFNYVKPGESRVFIYYVGHGAPDLDSGEAYFVPVDTDPQYLKTSGYRLKTFYNNLAQLPASQLTVVLDACFSGNSDSGLIFSGVSSLSLRAKQDYATLKNATVFASAQNDQVSTWYPEKRHSLFTYYFLKGLRGEADADRNAELTVAELEIYLAEFVPFMARRLKGNEQHPTVSGDRQRVLTVLE